MDLAGPHQLAFARQVLTVDAVGDYRVLGRESVKHQDNTYRSDADACRTQFRTGGEQ